MLSRTGEAPAGRLPLIIWIMFSSRHVAEAQI
jgi:hypothetical protein